MKHYIHILAKLVEESIGTDPVDIREWIKTPIYGLGTPSKMIENGEFRQLIQYLRSLENERK